MPQFALYRNRNPASRMRTLTPILKFEGKEFLMLTPQVAGIAARELGPVAGDLAPDRDKIIAAVDFLLSGI
jgi:toxin CcdB